MGRILAIDYGIKRTGLAVTDELKLSINGLPTVETSDLWTFLSDYCMAQCIELIVIGLPSHKDGNPTYLKDYIDKLSLRLTTTFSEIKVILVDERFSSFEAKQIILKSGIKKKKRREKKLVDKVSAMVILQRYLRTIV